MSFLKISRHNTSALKLNLRPFLHHYSTSIPIASNGRVYAVTRGHEAGIFASRDTAEKAVHKHSHGCMRRLDNKTDAENWLQDNDYLEGSLKEFKKGNHGYSPVIEWRKTKKPKDIEVGGLREGPAWVANAPKYLQMKVMEGKAEGRWKWKNEGFMRG